MFIVFGSENIQELTDKYINFELETIEVNGEHKTAYCVLPADALPISQYPEIDRLKKLHNHFIINYNKGNYEQSLEALQHIKGQLGADMDSFYIIMEGKIQENLLKRVEVNGS